MNLRFLLLAWSVASCATAKLQLRRKLAIVNEKQKIWALRGSTGDHYGYSVAVNSDENIAVGAVTTASVHMYERREMWNGAAIWLPTGPVEPEVVATEPDAADFGKSLALEGETLIVGARNAVYVFAKASDGLLLTRWTQIQKITVGNETSFGSALSFSGHTLAVSSVDTSSVYIFQEDAVTSTFTMLQKFTSATTDDGYGTSVALKGDKLLVGAPTSAFYDATSNATIASGCVYAYTRSNDAWSLTEKLGPKDVGQGMGYGTSIALDGHTAVIGAPAANSTVASRSGAAYVYDIHYYDDKPDRWKFETKIEASDAASDDFFGGAVAVEAEKIVVTAVAQNSRAGSAYTFVQVCAAASASGATKLQWRIKDKLLPEKGQAGSSYGSAVSIKGDLIVAGAYLDDEGAVYIYEYETKSERSCGESGRSSKPRK